MSSPKILDNSLEKFTLKNFLQSHLESGTFTQISIATGYWDLPAMLELLPSLKLFFESSQKNNLRLLIGEEPRVRANQIDSAFPEKYLQEDLRDLPLTPEFQEVVGFLVHYLDVKQIQIKLYKRSFLHAKCYILGSEEENAIGIIGSSNFTRNGLLGNTELNDVEYDHRIVNYLPKGQEQDASHRSWFEKVWNDELTENWNQQFSIDVLGLSKFGSITYSPYEMYIRTLYEIYGEDIEIEEKLKLEEGFETRVSLTVFQEESVRKVLARLYNHKIGMCLLGDSVGLGKSFIAKKVIEEFGYFKRQNVLVVCPASLRNDWEQHLKDITVNAPVLSITEFSQDDIFHGRIKEELLQRKKTSKHENAIELLVIDESHNLKTRGSNSFQNLLSIITDKRFCIEIPKVLMLSATPVNNGIKDLANQILLAKGGIDGFFTPLGIPSVITLFTNTQREFIKTESESVFENLYPILNKIMVKRTKHQVKKDFPDALLEGKPIIFPDEKLENVLYELDSKEIRKSISQQIAKLEKSNFPLFYQFTHEISDEEEAQEEKQGIIDFFQFVEKNPKKKINQTEYESVFHFIDTAIKRLKLIPYSYLTEKKVKSEEEEAQASARKSLTGIMKVTMFKSFDSSIFTFKKRIDKYERYLSTFEDLFFNHQRIVKPAIIQKAMVRQQDEPDEELMDLIFEEIDKFVERENEKKSDNARYQLQSAYTEIDLKDYNTERIKKFIQQDKDIIALVKIVLTEIKDDTKLKMLKDVLRKLKGKKVLIFSYFATTVDYLGENLDATFLSEIGLHKEQSTFLKSKNGKQKQEFVHRFSPKAQKQTVVDGKVNGKPELQLLCSTDVLSEGQNLQDCGIIINYDLHWNPVKMIQRNGRINRLGSEFQTVLIHNFQPEDQLDKYLKLMKKLQDKIRIIGATVGVDSSVLGEQITPKQFGLIEDIYSNDTEKQRKAIEELERENDLAFDEEFENDLREFMRKASDTEKDAILNINFNKWCAIPSLQGNNSLLSFNIGKGEFTFIETDGNKAKAEKNSVVGLRKIRSFDTMRQKEKLSYQQKSTLIEIAEKVFKAEQAYQETLEGMDIASFRGVSATGGVMALGKFKEQILTLLNENKERYSDDNIQRIRTVLTSTNIAFENKLRSYLKRFDNQISLDLLDTLVFFSIDFVRETQQPKLPEPELWFGYYSKER